MNELVNCVLIHLPDELIMAAKWERERIIISNNTKRLGTVDMIRLPTFLIILVLSGELLLN